jgi:NAD-dependent dihydropyrimidine dehydrogenase PreA subunit
MTEQKKPNDQKKKMGRREFLKSGGTALAAGALAAGIPASTNASSGKTDHPESQAYLVYDSRVCWGCQSCMFACSLAHYGEANPSFSRIQIIRDAPSFTTSPNDIVMAVCRQCVTPVCVENCPVGAA